MAQPAAPPPGAHARVSWFALVAMAGIAAGALAGIFAYIFLVLTIPFESRLWWAGVAAWSLALAFHVASATVGIGRVSHWLAGAFFLVGAGSFYGSIALSPDPVDTKLIWLIVLSGIVVALLAAIFVMARGSEADAERHAQRKITP